MRKFLLISILSLSGLTAGAASGLTAGAATTKDFTLEKLILEAQKTCPKLNCPERALRVVQMSTAEHRALGTVKRAQLKELGVRLAEDLWGDTILEGPFEHAGRYRLDQVQKLMLHDVLVGYRITYSDKAWDLDTCSYDPSNRRSLETCETGRITESAFVDQDALNIYRDYEAMAEFVSDAAKKR
ncbi:MAG: hypothetical protein ACK5P7_03125 [Bdellovibrio sp.]